MAFSQSDIDAASIYEDLKNNPGGGNNEDYTEVCTLLESFTKPGEPLYWQSGEDETAAGFTKHKIGVTHPRGTNVSYLTSPSTSTGYGILTLPFLAEVLEIGAIPLRPCMENTFTFRDAVYNSGFSHSMIFYDHNGNEKVFTISTDLQLRDNRHKIPFTVRGTDFAFKSSSAATSLYDIVYYIIYKPWDGRLTLKTNTLENMIYFTPRACAKLISASCRLISTEATNVNLTNLVNFLNETTSYNIFNGTLALDRYKYKDIVLSTASDALNFKTNNIIGFGCSATAAVEVNLLFDKHDR